MSFPVPMFKDNQFQVGAIVLVCWDNAESNRSDARPTQTIGESVEFNADRTIMVAGGNGGFPDSFGAHKIDYGTWMLVSCGFYYMTPATGLNMNQYLQRIA